MKRQLTEWVSKRELLFAEKQLKKYGAKEGKDYWWRHKIFKETYKERWSIWIKGV